MNSSDLLAEVDRRASELMVKSVLWFTERLDTSLPVKITDADIIDRMRVTGLISEYEIRVSPITFDVFLWRRLDSKYESLRELE